MEIQIPGHGRGLGDGGAGEVVRGTLAAAFEAEIRLRGVNAAEESAVAGETDRGVAGQPVILEVLGQGGIVDDTVAADARARAGHVNGQTGAGTDVDLGRRFAAAAAAATTDRNRAGNI